MVLWPLNIYMTNIVILTGAGISAESGIATFRDQSGLWENHDVDLVSSPDGFARDPETVLRFCNARIANMSQARPNAAHIALAEMEREFSGNVLIITQNVDGLQQKAGCRNVLEMHGSFSRSLCSRCGYTEPCLIYNTEMQCSRCNAGGIRPDVVWFGEMPHHLEEIEEALLTCDIFISIGTSGNVQPASLFVAIVAQNGCHETIEINPQSTRGSFIRYIRETAGIAVPVLVRELLAR